VKQLEQNAATRPPRKRGVQPLLVGFGVVSLLGLVLIGALRGGASPLGADPTVAREVALGREVYLARCASCHGVNLEGQPNWKDGPLNGPSPAPPHDANGHTWHHPDALLFDIVKNGGQQSSPETYINAMPAFGGVLSDREIWAVLSYLKSTWPPDILAAQEEVNRQSP
jgi:mono/diheme cytochrome c family protein